MINIKNDVTINKHNEYFKHNTSFQMEKSTFFLKSNLILFLQRFSQLNVGVFVVDFFNSFCQMCRAGSLFSLQALASWAGNLENKIWLSQEFVIFNY